MSQRSHLNLLNAAMAELTRWTSRFLQKDIEARFVQLRDTSIYPKILSVYVLVRRDVEFRRDATARNADRSALVRLLCLTV